MGSSINPAIWFFVCIITQDSTTKAKAAEEQVLTFFYLKTIPYTGGTVQFSLLPRL